MSELWEQLHRNALGYRGNDDSVFLTKWASRIPRYTKGCRCKEFWTKWRRANPPDFSSPEAYFAWTVKAHNAVNQKLDRPVWTVEQALARWLETNTKEA